MSRLKIIKAAVKGAKKAAKYSKNALATKGKKVQGPDTPYKTLAGRKNAASKSTKNVRAKTGLNKKAPAAAKKVVAKKAAYKPKVGEPKPPLSKATKKANDVKVAQEKVQQKSTSKKSSSQESSSQEGSQESTS